MPILSRLRNAWNIFKANEQTVVDDYAPGAPSYTSAPPSRPRRTSSNERTIISAIYTRIAIDVASVAFRHVQFDENERYIGDINSPLNDCLTFEPNLDQGPRAFRQDIAMTLLDRGVAAIVPVDTTRNPDTMEIVDIYSLRVGDIVGWKPKHIRVSLYNENKGTREEIMVPKQGTAIIENPMFTVMNDINSTYQRLVKKLSYLDAVDEQSASGKLDLIIQLPYVVKSDARRKQAEQRREEIEVQLKGSQYGIAYTDGTEKITQLNRPAENNLLKQVEYLTDMLHNQLGITAAVLDGTADQVAMLNYFSRTIEPIVDAIKEGMQRSFVGLTKTKKRQRIHYFKDAFKLVPMEQLAELTDKFTRNEVLTSNEIRQIIGFKPANDPKADQLINSNMPQADRAAGSVAAVDELDKVMDEVFNGLSEDIDAIVGGASGKS